MKVINQAGKKYTVTDLYLDKDTGLHMVELEESDGQRITREWLAASLRHAEEPYPPVFLMQVLHYLVAQDKPGKWRPACATC